MPAWTQDDKDRVNSAVEAGGLGYRESAEKYKVPRSTLERRLNNPELGKHGKKTLLDQDTELILVTLIFFMADLGFGLCKLQILAITKSFLVEQPMAHIFKDGVPTNRWYYMFLGRLHVYQLDQLPECLDTNL